MHIGAGGHTAAADRTIAVDATDQLRFTPSTLTVRAGETVAFRVTNTGKTMHEFVIGDAAAQAAHEQEMAAGHLDMGHDANAVEVPAGATRTLVYTFTTPGALLIGCHAPGHYAAGMQGTITVEPS
jgi:uncharacterized cupredoxin-like copper-binding protein